MFLLNDYQNLLSLALEKQYKFVDYSNLHSFHNSILLRHDVDSELWHCLPMARIEHSLGVRATYFLMFRSNSYNLFCVESLHVVKELIDLGHSIGLHYMGELSENDFIEEIQTKVLWEVGVMEKEFGVKIHSVSFHQPTDKILKNSIFIGDLVNTYNKEQLKDFYYISDSNMNWRGNDPIEMIQSKKYNKIQFLIHPMWWTEKEMDLLAKWKTVLQKNMKSIIGHWTLRENTLKDVKPEDLWN
jgi:hypothetical protein